MRELIAGIILYTPPNNFLAEFLDNMENALHSIYLSKKKCLILGDNFININTVVKKLKSRKYLNFINSEGFNPLIFEATHAYNRKLDQLYRPRRNNK